MVPITIARPSATRDASASRVELVDRHGRLGAQARHHPTAALPEGTLERGLTVVGLVVERATGRAPSAQGAGRAQRIAGPTQPRAHVHEREQTVARHETPADPKRRRLGLGRRQSPPRHPLHDPPHVDLDGRSVDVVGEGADRSRGVAADTREVHEIVGPTVLRDDRCRFPQSARPARIPEPVPGRDDRARAGGRCRLRIRELRHERRPRDQDPRDLGLLQHHFRHEHRPAVARQSPGQIVASFALVPAAERAAGHAPRVTGRRATRRRPGS